MGSDHVTDQVIQPVNMEEILEKLGGFGRFQVLVLVSILLLEIPAAWLMFSPLVIATVPVTWLCDGEQVTSRNICSCTGNITALAPEESIIAEWHLICNSAWIPDAITSLQLSGIVVGNLMSGFLSDWYGRRLTMLFYIFQMIFSFILTGGSPNPYVYALARFASGCSFSGSMSIMIVYTMEFMTPSWRLLTSSVGPFGIGIMLLSLLAYYVRQWRTLVYISSIPSICGLIVFFIVPESPRWLLRNQKIEECGKVLKRIAQVNRKPALEPQTIKDIAARELQELKASERLDENGKPKRFSLLTFYTNPSLRRTTLCLQGLWFAWAVVYFGISFNARNLGLDLYTSTALMGLVDALGYPVPLLLDKKLGRLQMLVLFMSCAGVFLIAIAVLNIVMDLTTHVILVGILSLLGKYCISAGRTALRTVTGESFPTAIRSTGIGFSGTMASLGAVVAPQLVFFGSKWPSVPYFGFAAAGIIGILASVFLKETSGQALTDEVTKTKKRPKTDIQTEFSISVPETEKKI